MKRGNKHNTHEVAPVGILCIHSVMFLIYVKKRPCPSFILNKQALSDICGGRRDLSLLN